MQVDTIGVAEIGGVAAVSLTVGLAQLPAAQQAGTVPKKELDDRVARLNIAISQPQFLLWHSRHATSKF